MSGDVLHPWHSVPMFPLYCRFLTMNHLVEAQEDQRNYASCPCSLLCGGDGGRCDKRSVHLRNETLCIRDVLFFEGCTTFVLRPSNWDSLYQRLFSGTSVMQSSIWDTLCIRECVLFSSLRNTRVVLTHFVYDLRTETLCIRDVLFSGRSVMRSSIWDHSLYQRMFFFRPYVHKGGSTPSIFDLRLSGYIRVSFVSNCRYCLQRLVALRAAMSWECL